MKFLSLGIILLALTFCGLADRLKNLSGAGSNSSSNTAGGPSKTSGDTTAERPTLTGEQRKIQDSAAEVNWNEQGISWKLPATWKKMDVKKESFNYSSPDLAFLLVNISPIPDSLPTDQSLQAFYDEALQKIKQGKNESARFLEIDGVKGIEFVESMPESKDDSRRHQWLAYRNYLGQKQFLNIMLTTKGSNFEKHRDDFAAIMYSIKIPKG